MSTISDALKKAQKNRQGNILGAAPPLPHESPRIPTPPPSPPVTRSRTLLIVLLAAVVSLCLVFFILRELRPQSPRTLPLAATKSEPPPPTAPLNALPLSKSPEITPTSQTEPGADKNPEPPPPPPPPAPAAPADLPALAGIFYATQNPVAIINGTAMKEGEITGNYRVVKIQPYTVILKSSAGEFELKLK